MKTLMGNSKVPNYLKLTATAILALTYLSALFVAVDLYIERGPSAPLPSIVTFVLGTGLSLALSTLGMHSGAQLAESGGSTTNASNPTA